MITGLMIRTSAQPDVVVVGSGILGLSVVDRMLRSGRRVTWCVGRDAEAGATAASGAMLSVLGEVSPGDDERELLLRVRAAARHEDWRSELGLPAARNGTFVVGAARRRRDLETVRAIEAAATQHGLRCVRVDAEEVPGLRPAGGWGPAQVLHLPDEGWVDAPELLRSARRTLEADAQVACVAGEVLGVVQAAGRVCGVRTGDGGRIAAEEVVLCVGAQVARVISGSGLDVGCVPALLPSKGVGILLGHSRSESTIAHVLRTPNREFACGVHVLPRSDGSVYLGATNRVSRFPQTLGGVTAGEVSLLLGQALRELTSTLAGWTVTGSTWGYRPLSVDGRPVAGRTILPGLSVATGTYRNGVLLAPLLADVVADDLEASADARPSENEFSPAREIVQRDPISILRVGLAEMSGQLSNGEDLAWEGTLPLLLAALGTAGFSEDDLATRLRDQVLELMRRYPRVEMVPEALIEMLQEDAAGQ
jgi:glycine/D-amino acid oxidase-like deaminating enzyme